VRKREREREREREIITINKAQSLNSIANDTHLMKVEKKAEEESPLIRYYFIEIGRERERERGRERKRTQSRE